MIKNRYGMPPQLKEALKVIRRGGRAVELHERGLDKNNLLLHLIKPIG